MKHFFASLREKNYPLYLLSAFLPAALFLVWLAVMRLTGTPVSLLPTASDETSWYRQISAVISSNMPLGYYGYNGTHALHGTFGPWGIAILLPYALWGKLFGWGLTSMCVANVTFLGSALCLFCFFCRLTKREYCYVLICYCTLLMNLFYSAFSMGESLRWSMAILLCGCMVRISRGWCGPIFRYVFTPLLLLFCSEAYLLLALFIPIYLLLVLPIRRLWAKLSVSLGISVVIAFSLRSLLQKITSPYNLGLQPASSLGELLARKTDSALKVLFQISPMGLWKHRGDSFGFPAMIIGTFLFFLIFCTVRALLLRKETAGRIYLSSAFLMAGTVAGYALIYHNPTFWTLCRGLNMSLVCAVLLLALHGRKSNLVLCVLCAFLCLPAFYRVSRNNLSNRFLSEKQEALLEESKELYAELFDISAENSRWENTIALYGTRKPGAQTALSLALPENAGYNSMRNTSVVSEAKYAVVYNSFPKKETYETILTTLQDNGYRIIHKRKTLTILAR